MSPFNFQAIQTLDIETEDNPKIDVQNNRLILTATRDGDQIRITAPIKSFIASSEQAFQQVGQPLQQTNSQKRKARSRRRKTHYTTVNRSSGFKSGEESPNSKLKETDVREIRTLANDHSYRNTFSSEHAFFKELAKAYNVHFTTIYQIVRGATWKHVAI